MNTNHIYINKTKKLLKYLILSLISAVALKYIPANDIEINEIIMIGTVISFSFAILDIISPNIKILNDNIDENSK